MKPKTKTRIFGTIFGLSLLFLFCLVGSLEGSKISYGATCVLMVIGMIVCAVSGWKSGALR